MLIQRCALSQHRLIIPVSVTKPSLHGTGFVSTFSNQEQYTALIDTGAQRSVLARSIIAHKQLLRTGHMQFSSLHGPQTHSRYLASIALWAKRSHTRPSEFEFENGELSLFSLEEPFEIVDMQDNANFDMILGFDTLKAFSFSFDSREQKFEIIVKP